MGALAAWRPSQGIYRFDPDVAQAVMETDFDKTLPSEILMRMPEWCVYIDLTNTNAVYHSKKLAGFYAHLESDANNGRRELRLLLDVISPSEDLVGIPIHIDNDLSLSDAIESAYNTGLQNLGGEITGLIGTSLLSDRAKQEAKYFGPLVGLVLYLCSKNAEVRNNRSGIGLEGLKRPVPKKTKQGLRFFQADRPEIWDVGFGLGKQIREGKGVSGGTHAGPRPHIRRAHWHTFWEGPMAKPSKPEDRKTSGTASRTSLCKRNSLHESVKNSATQTMPKLRTITVKWLPPIPVAMETEEIRPTVRLVK